VPYIVTQLHVGSEPVAGIAAQYMSSAATRSALLVVLQSA
jgi:hypothetical protein